MFIRFAKKFVKQRNKAPKNIDKVFKDRLGSFINNSQHPQLNNHKLSGNFKGLRSINITGNWRAIFSEQIDEHGNVVIIFELLGTHSQLYK